MLWRPSSRCSSAIRSIAALSLCGYSLPACNRGEMALLFPWGQSEGNNFSNVHFLSWIRILECALPELHFIFFHSYQILHAVLLCFGPWHVFCTASTWDCKLGLNLDSRPRLETECTPFLCSVAILPQCSFQGLPLLCFFSIHIRSSCLSATNLNSACR